MNFCLHGSARTVKEAVERAQRAEALGFEAIFFADSQMNNVDPYQAMALCAVNTKTIRFGTAVTNMVYRDPTITACSYATLERNLQRPRHYRHGHRRRAGLQPGPHRDQARRFRKRTARDSRPFARPRRRRAQEP